MHRRPRNTRTGTRRPSRRRPNAHRAPGLGLVELLIALAITAMLLTSVAIAFHAALTTADENQKIASVTHCARVVLHRMITEARRAEAVETDTSRLSALPIDDGSGLILVEYEMANGVLWYRQYSGAVHTYPLLGDEDGVTVHDFWVARETGVDGEGQSYTQNITARLDLSVGDNRFAVTSSTNPRRNLEW